ncbi:MAG TPA: response regulator [Pirellulales bacterium]|nr:response regulator [Pirellulales bacterium]
MLPLSQVAADQVVAGGDAGRSSAALVLIVEDNSTNARLTAHMLKAGGYQTAIAPDGQQGLDMARELLPDLVLADLQMPGLDGLSLTRLLKQDAATAGIPIVALTAHAMADHREQALEAGCVAFIAKPIRLQSFLDEVCDVLQRHAIGR